MSTTPSYPVCRHYAPGAPRVCHLCRPTPPPAYDTSPYAARKQATTERYLQEAQIQRARDVEALNRQRPSLYETWGNSRSVAANIIGGADPSTLPSSYPYATTIDEQDFYTPTGAGYVPQRPPHRPHPGAPYDSQRTLLSEPQQGQVQRPAGYVNGFSEAHGAVIRPPQATQVAPQRTEGVGRTDSAGTPNPIPSARQTQANRRRPYRQ
ncbi:hypothetical protein CB0940_11142 [Cercospora beticola]|uniref:Uncharacterized protein n=1 Tax=Cercospora beticola TaxID=122368 RepID=A0A2G5HDP0_CERBT|nr:hypothetical protein CB0940_11142 [Cercospora beticola]PIA90383.1 hypothetical protein CB0940_11142 [Cercospora beticola]WPB07972.1 hypothetical protein RHO25_012636 [Cercospora beticola]CAK1368176.1 unnamed protein product [Cercospora beticola]